MVTHLKSLVPLRQARHRTVLDAVWSTQLNLSNIGSIPTLLDYLQMQPALKRAGVLESHVVLPSVVNAALGSVCNEVSVLAQKLNLLAPSEAANLLSNAILMSMRGAQPHTDIPTARWMDKLFWALSLQDTDTDVLFGNLCHRIPLMAGTLLVFDPCQPHAVIAREHSSFKKSHFPKGRVQLCAGGDFPAKDWAALGVSHRLTDKDLAERRDVVNVLVNQETCQVKRANSLESLS
jgi:hypothetical protein